MAWVNARPLICRTPYGMASGGQEEPFFQIGLGCVMSHHQLPHRRALHIPVLILAGKFKVEFLPTVTEKYSL